jgi:hypothetical protein
MYRIKNKIVYCEIFFLVKNSILYIYIYIYIYHISMLPNTFIKNKILNDSTPEALKIITKKF